MFCVYQVKLHKESSLVEAYDKAKEFGFTADMCNDK